jgi:ubiquinone/menaquinone biosynthesis C-methylase UbiE
MATWQSDNLFSGTAWYYARFRPDYPEEVINLLCNNFGLGRKSRVLDLGCGTGQIALQLAPFVSEVIAVDPQEEMLQEGKAISSANGRTNIKWILGESANINNLSEVIGQLDLTVIARAFHWMDREQTLRDVYSMTKLGGGMSIVSDSGPQDKPTEWKEVIDAVVRHWLGDTRRAGTKGTYSHPTDRWEDTLQESQFCNFESKLIKTKRVWNLDRIVGYLYSKSSSSIPVLGDKKEGFEKDVRQRLTTMNFSGVFEEDVTTEVFMMWKK